MARALRPSRYLWLAATLVACNGVLGIEDLYDGPRPGAGGTDSDAGEGGSSAAGKANTGGTNITPEGGAGSEGGSGAKPTGGAAGDAPTPIGGDNTGGAVEPGNGTVRGHVIDFWGHKLANVPVRIGDAVTSTDEDGAFEVENVPATYDVSFVAEFEFNTVPRTWAWYYHGLTRRDPTLQANQGSAPIFGSLEITPQTATIGANQTISVAVGSEDGSTDLTAIGATTVKRTVAWDGPSTTSATAHGLQWEREPTSKVPTSYVAYDSTPVTLAEDATLKISLSFAPDTLNTGFVKGKVTPVSGKTRYNQVFLQFTSGATLQLVSEASAPDTFSYLVPSIPSSTLTVLASEGDYSFGEYAVARAGGVAPGADLSLALPKPVQLTSPGSDAENVTGATTFSFQSSASSPGPYVAQIENVDVDGVFQTLFVVTAEKTFKIPQKMAADFKLQTDKTFEWRIATHGKLGSVDDMTGPDGFLQPFDLGNELPYGPLQGDGEYSISNSRLFTTPK